MNYNIDIILLFDNKIKKSLKGHENHITTVRYFINPKNNNEYLISADYDFFIFVWDIHDNYNRLYQFISSSKIFSSLIIFSIEKDKENKIIFVDKKIKIYSLENGIRLNNNINNNNNNNNYINYRLEEPSPNYLLGWHNKKNAEYYIINFNDYNIEITNLSDIKYATFRYIERGKYYSGFIYTEKDKDILCNNNSNGQIQFWDLYDKKLIKFINTGKGHLTKLIKWSEKFIISVIYLKNFRIIDISQNKAISNIGSNIIYE